MHLLHPQSNNAANILECSLLNIRVTALKHRQSLSELGEPVKRKDTSNTYVIHLEYNLKLSHKINIYLRISLVID